jgi:hypothetical protein
MKQGVMLLALMLSIGNVSAHTLDCLGNPVPAHVKEGCCGKGDALQLKPGELRGNDHDGWEAWIDGAWRFVAMNGQGHLLAQPSEDGCTWVWYRRASEDGMYHVDTAHSATGAFSFYCLQVEMGE